jgi:2,3-bisphosphoglycerate-dependent phosphoglycerate mutase
MIQPMNLLLIRHGETALNVARVLQPAATPLSAIDTIVSSDLPRALRTAQAIAASTGAPIETTPLLHERNFGDWRGRPYDGMPINPLTMHEAPPGGESLADFERRVALAFAHVLRRHAETGQRLAVVTHGMLIRVLLGAHVRLPLGVSLPAHFGNTSLSIFDARAPHAATLVNCTAHLQAATCDNAQALSGG